MRRGVRIRRDYAQPFFSRKQQSPLASVRLVFLFGLLLGGMMVFVVWQFDRLQLAALETVGQAPPPTAFPSEYASRGYDAYMAGDLDTAVDLLGRAAQMRPDNVDYQYEYGRVLIEADREEDAIPIADRLLERFPNDVRGYTLRARALMWSDPAQAIQIAINGNEIDPGFGPLHAVQGVAYYNLNRWQESIAEGRLAIELAPMDPFVHRAIHYVLVYTGRYAEAIEALQTAISLNPNLISPYFELAFIHKLPQVGEPELAVVWYNRILERDPDNPRAYLRLCETYAGVDNADFGTAQDYCDAALEIDPGYGSAYRETGRMQYNRRNYEGSIESFETCVALGATDIECWYLRGLAHYWLDQCDAAWDVLQEARQIGQEQGQGEGVMNAIEIGLFNVTQNCENYRNIPTPTVPPPTQIPPTPIGGGFG